jgi:hypothetical protein
MLNKIVDWCKETASVVKNRIKNAYERNKTAVIFLGLMAATAVFSQIVYEILLLGVIFGGIFAAMYAVMDVSYALFDSSKDDTMVLNTKAQAAA